MKSTKRRVERVEKILEHQQKKSETGFKEQMFVIQHILAREYGWTPKQVKSLYVEELQSELALLNEDLERRKS